MLRRRKEGELRGSAHLPSHGLTSSPPPRAMGCWLPPTPAVLPSPQPRLVERKRRVQCGGGKAMPCGRDVYSPQ